MSGGETDISPKMSGGETGLQERGRYEDFNGEDQTLDDLEKGKYAKVHYRKASMLKYTTEKRVC